MFPDGHIGPGGPYDGIVTLNSALPPGFSFTRPLIFGSFDAQRSVEHEIDEVMGLGSYLNRNAPPACPSYEAESPICPQPGECSIVAGGAVIQPCPNCSGGFDVGFVGNNSGTLQFNQVFANASGSLNVRNLVRQRRCGGAPRLSERERRSRNVFDLSVHWLVSDCRVNTDDS